MPRRDVGSGSVYTDYEKQSADHKRKCMHIMYVSDAATVSVHINRLREKLEDGVRNPQIIETVWVQGIASTVHR